MSPRIVIVPFLQAKDRSPIWSRSTSSLGRLLAYQLSSWPWWILWKKLESWKCPSHLWCSVPQYNEFPAWDVAEACESCVQFGLARQDWSRFINLICLHRESGVNKETTNSTTTATRSPLRQNEDCRSYYRCMRRSLPTKIYANRSRASSRMLYALLFPGGMVWVSPPT